MNAFIPCFRLPVSVLLAFTSNLKHLTSNFLILPSNFLLARGQRVLLLPCAFGAFPFSSEKVSARVSPHKWLRWYPRG